MYQLIIKPRAEADIDLIVVHYEEIEPGLSRRFLTALDDALARLRVFAKHAYYKGNTRRVIIRKYEYLIYYEFDESMGLVIVKAVIHSKRKEVGR